MLIAAQLLIAVITVAIILIVGLKIKPLIEKKAELEKEVVILTKDKTDLENTIGGLEKHIHELEVRIEETMVFDRNRLDGLDKCKIFIKCLHFKAGKAYPEYYRNENG